MAEEVNKSAGSMRAVDRVVAILELFQGSRELTMSEVANATGLNLSTTFRYLGALAEHGWLVAQPSGSYRLSIRVFHFLFSSGLGKSILACLPKEEVLRLQAGVELKPITERTITSLDELLEDLELVRTRGYSLDDEESEVGLMCVAGAIHDHHGFPRYAISVSGPTERIRSALECGLGESVASAVSAVSRDLGNFTATSQF